MDGLLGKFRPIRSFRLAPGFILFDDFFVGIAACRLRHR
jgi:hypothetical protein